MSLKEQQDKMTEEDKQRIIKEVLEDAKNNEDRENG